MPWVTLQSGEHVRIVTIHQCQHMTWYSARTDDYQWFEIKCDAGSWRVLNGGEQAWLAHKDDWMRYA